MRRYWRQMVLVAFVLLSGALLVGALWLNDLADPTEEAIAAMASDASVAVTTGERLEFEPAEPVTTGFILYPGARIAPEAYAPLARAIAEAGYLAVITPMPFGLAVLSPGAADTVIADHPEIDHWVIGGHSLGGAMAAQYTVENDDRVDGLALWAAYPAEGTDLSGADIKAASISASNDGLATPDEIQASAARLPAETAFVEIEGGNHAQFGWYGEQGGDGEATIGHADQQDQTLAATLALLEAVSTAG